MSEKVTVVGGGVGGCRAALEAAKRGYEVELWEKSELGGVCLNSGCVPTKALLNIACRHPRRDEWQEIRESIATKIGLLRRGMERQLKRAKVNIIHDEFIGPSDGTVIWAAGRSWPQVPEIPGKTVFDHRGVLALETIPDEIAIVGAGVTGMEYARIFSALGSRVTVYEKSETVLPTFPDWAAERMMCAMLEDGIDFRLGAEVSLSDIPQEHIFLALGAKNQPIPEDVFAVGDASGVTATAYEAERDATKTVDIISGRIHVQPKVEIHVVCGFYDLVTVGELEGCFAEADCSGSAAAFMADALAGFARLYCREDGTICGACLMLPHAADMAGTLAALIESGASVTDLARATFFHPGVSECIKEAAVKLRDML